MGRCMLKRWDHDHCIFFLLQVVISRIFRNFDTSHTYVSMMHSTRSRMFFNREKFGALFNFKIEHHNRKYFLKFDFLVFVIFYFYVTISRLNEKLDRKSAVCLISKWSIR